METYTLAKELKIQNVTESWDKIGNIEKPIEIILDEVEDFDGAGMQLIMHLYNLSDKNSESYTITNNSKELSDKLKSFGFIPNGKREE